jgi:hypothetical protein
MKEHSRDALRKRQAQWDAFRQWETSRDLPALSLEERIGWYVAADRFSRACSSTAAPEEIQMRVKQIQAVRDRLAYLDRG